MPLRGWTVDFTFDAEQLALQDVARRAMDEVGGDTLRELADDPVGYHARAVGPAGVPGWTAMLVPGEGAGLLETCIVLEQMGRVPLPGPFFSSSVMATLAARALGADDLLAGLATGRQRGTVALHEQGNGHPLGTVRARARRKGCRMGGDRVQADSWWTGTRPTGPSWWRWARTGSARSCCRRRRPRLVPALDPTRKLARLVLDEEPVEPLGPPGDQARCGERVLDDVAVALAAELVGVADRALEEAVEYAKVRVVFDRPSPRSNR